MNTDGIRYTHPRPDRIGKHFVGTIEPALNGEPVVEEIEGTIGRLVQAVVPVENPDGEVVGLVSAGITLENVGGATEAQLPLVLGAALAALALATGGAALISRRLLHQTHGLGPHEMTRMYEHHDAVLHAVREGVMILDGDGTLLLANDEARRLFSLPEDAEGGTCGIWVWIRPRRSCCRRAARPRTRCFRWATGCSPSTSGPPTRREGTEAASPPSATPRSCGRCPAGRRSPASG